MGVAFLNQGGNVVLISVHVGAAVMLVSYAIAITKYRLYDIDVVISKTVAYVSLAAVIATLYVTAVFGLVTLFGQSNQRVVDLGAEYWIAATALVAIVFEPLRVRMQRWADRVAFGKRAAPHQVLSQLTSQLSETSSSEGLVGLAQLLREGTGAESALVWLRVGDRLRVEAVSPADTLPSISVVEAEEDLPTSEVEVSVPVRHGGDLLGALGVTKPRSHPVTPADKALLSDVAAGAGLFLRNLRLNAELAKRAVELQASRRRLITAHDAARHRLERDLHDGAQQQVVALKVRLGLAKTIAEREGAQDLAARVAELADGTQQAVDAMRIVARGIYPPLLDAEGLGPALAAMHRAVDMPLQVDVGTLPRYSKEAEETAYFCVSAAVTQATMAGATSAQIDVHGNDTSLALAVSYDSAERDALAALTDRVDAFGGTVTTSTSADRTTITLALPVEDEVMEPA
jgi:signal transduction histidine kinase